MNQSIITGSSYGSVNEVFSWPESDYCAVKTCNDWLRLYDLKRREFVQEFRIPDSGGMSVAVSADDRFLFLATYYSWGMACVEIASRKFVWRRKDLKRFNGLSFSPKDNCLYAEFDRGSAIKIDSMTGETIAKFPRIGEVSVSSYGDYVLMCDPKYMCLRDTAGNSLQKWPREGFKVLTVGWSTQTIAIVECVDLLTLQEKYGTRVYDLKSGALVWRQPRKETQPLGIMFKPEGEYVAIEGLMKNLGKNILVHLDEQTGSIKRQPIPVTEMMCKMCGRGVIACCLCGKGSFIFAIDQYTFEIRVFPVGA